MITMFNQVWRYTMLTRPQEPASPLFCPPSRAVKMPFFFFFFFLAKQPSIRGIAPRPYTVTAPWIEWDIARVRCFANETQRIVNGHVHHIVNRTDPRCISSHPLSSFFPPLFHRVYFPFFFFFDLDLDSIVLLICFHADSWFDCLSHRFDFLTLFIVDDILKSSPRFIFQWRGIPMLRLVIGQIFA